METRPDIRSIKTGEELRRWYWRKDELMSHTRHLGLKSSGGKFVILDRIAHFLDTGDHALPMGRAAKPMPDFDWQKEPLSRRTIITENYKNTQNVRRFFQREIGPSFRFNIAFMEWMRANPGQTLGDACEAFRAFEAQSKTPGFKTKIKSHNQFNQYTRDFLQDNPDLDMSDVRRIWALKIKLPSESGRHIYESSDLDLAGNS